MGHKEVMSHFFREDEHEKVEQRLESSDYKEKMEALKAKAAIDIKLMKLKAVTEKTEENFEERYKAFIEALSNTNPKDLATAAATTIEKAAGDAVDTAKSTATEAVRWSIFWKIKAITDSVIAKIAASFWIGATGVAFLSENINPVSWLKSELEGSWFWNILGIKAKVPAVAAKDEGEKEEKEVVKPVKPKEEETPKEEAPDNEEKEEEGGDKSPEVEWTETFIMYRTGAKLIYALNWDHGEFEVKASEQILGNIDELTYNDIVALWNNTAPLLKDTEWKEEYAASLLEEYQSDKTQLLLKVGLTKSSLWNIIKPSGKINTRLARHFWKTQALGEGRLKEIYQQSQEEGFNWKELKFQEISILYLSSLSALRVPAAKGLWEVSSDVSGFMFGGIEWFDEVENYWVVSKTLAVAIWKIGTSVTKDEYMNPSNDQKFRDNVTENLWIEVDPEDIESLEKFIKFKNELKTGNFFDHPKLKLSPEQREEAKEKIKTNEALAIFSILSGNSDLNTINVLSLPVLLFSISGILANGWTQSAYESRRYLGNYLLEVLTDDNNSDILSEDEMGVLKIYGEKMASVIFATYLWNHLSVLGYSWGVTGADLGDVAIKSFVWGFGLKYVWGKFIKNGIKKWTISIPWWILKKLGWAGMIFGAVTWAVNWYTNPEFWNFDREAKEARESWDIEKVIEVLKKHQKYIKKYSTPEWKEIIALTYPGDTPFFVMEGKIYGMRVWELDLISKFNNATQSKDFWDSLGDFWKSLLWNGTWIIDGVDYTKQSFIDDKIVFGEWDKTDKRPIDEILELTKAHNEQIIWQDIIRKLTSGEIDPPIIGNKGIRWFPITNLGNNNILFLTEIWDINDIYKQ